MMDDLNSSKPLKSVLNKLIKQYGWQDAVYEEQVKEAWEAVVGRMISNEAKVSSFNNGYLTIVTGSPVWRMELSSRKNTILDDLNLKLGPDIVKDIKIIIG